MHLSVKIYLKEGDKFILGPGRLALLQALDELGSLSKASEKYGMSYRWAWGRLNKTKEYLDNPLIQRAKESLDIQNKETVDGRSMSLTSEGRELIAWFAEVDQEVNDTLRRMEAKMPRFLKARVNSPASRSEPTPESEKHD